MRCRATLVLSLVVLGLAGCRNLPSRRPLLFESTVEQGRRDVQAMAETRDWIGARRLGDLLLRSDPGDATLEALAAEMPPELRALFEPSLAGSNRAFRLPLERPLWQRIALWLPDRLLDLCDVVSFDVAFGIGLYADVHVTRAVQLAAGGRTSLGVGWHDGRSLGTLLQSESGLAYGPYDAILFGSGTADVFGASRMSGAHSPFDPLYQGVRDYWAVGGAVHALLIGVSVDVHPLEIADFVAGVFTYDWLGDDLATTSAPPELGERFPLMVTLQELALDTRGQERWREWRDEQAAKRAEASDAQGDASADDAPAGAAGGTSGG